MFMVRNLFLKDIYYGEKIESSAEIPSTVSEDKVSENNIEEIAESPRRHWQKPEMMIMKK